MTRIILALALLCCPLLTAQNVALEVSPNPVMSGGTVTVKMTAVVPNVAYQGNLAATAPANLCPPQIYDVPGGNLMFCGGFAPLCQASPGTPLPPCSSVSAQVTTCGGPGNYVLKVNYLLNGQFAGPEWVPFTIQGATTDPVLSAVSPATIGQTLVMNITAPNHPGALYAAGLSATTNAGIPLSPTLFLNLDDDPLFQLSVVSPLLIGFQNSVNVLDVSGNTTMMLPIPNVAILQCKPLHVQAVVDITGAYGPLIVTNALNYAIQ